MLHFETVEPRTLSLLKDLIALWHIRLATKVAPTNRAEYAADPM